MSQIKLGFEPVCDEHSRLLILGSFPSVKSREISFYYGNPRNAFWNTVCEFFNVVVPQTVEGKREFLLKNKIALWDIVSECEIDGSKDDTIKNYKVADIKKVLQNSKISYIILNGGKAYSIFESNFKDLGVQYVKLPSTSPANPRFKKEIWFDTLSRIFTRT